MKIFFRLLLAHLLTDFTLQTNFVARWKKQSFLGVLAHSLTFLVFALILTWSDINKIWFNYPIKLNGLVCILILFFLHLIEDEYRAYNVRHYHIQDTILFFLWDQVIHITFLFVFSPYYMFESVEPLIVILCIFIISTHALSVFVLYTDSIFYTRSLAYEFFKKKYYPIFLNIIILLFFVLPAKIYMLSILVIPLAWILNKKIKYASTIGWWINTLTPYMLGIVTLHVLGKI